MVQKKDWKWLKEDWRLSWRRFEDSLEEGWRCSWRRLKIDLKLKDVFLKQYTHIYTIFLKIILKTHQNLFFAILVSLPYPLSIYPHPTHILPLFPTFTWGWHQCGVWLSFGVYGWAHNLGLRSAGLSPSPGPTGGGRWRLGDEEGLGEEGIG